MATDTDINPPTNVLHLSFFYLQHYLQRFGYMNESTDAAQNLISENTYSHALMDFQRFAGLNETGMQITAFNYCLSFCQIDIESTDLD